MACQKQHYFMVGKIPDNYCCYLKKMELKKKNWYAESVIFLSRKGFMMISTAEMDVWKWRVCRLKKAFVKTKMSPGAAKFAQWGAPGWNAAATATLLQHVYNSLATENDSRFLWKKGRDYNWFLSLFSGGWNVPFLDWVWKKWDRLTYHALVWTYP